MVLYKYPFETWLSNIKGINLSEQDKKVTKILEGLEKLSDVDMGNQKNISKQEFLLKKGQYYEL